MCDSWLGKLQVQVDKQSITIRELQTQVQELQDTQWRLLRLLTDTRNQQGVEWVEKDTRVGGA